MKFKIGPYTYAVHRRRTLKLNGVCIDGFCASSARIILLCSKLSDEVLVATLRHEHVHAWSFEVGTPRTNEDVANFAAFVGAAFDAEFAEQGGLEALKALPIEEPIRKTARYAAHVRA